MGKRKKHPETDEEKEFLIKRELKTRIAANIAGVIVGAITAVSVLLTAIADFFK